MVYLDEIRVYADYARHSSPIDKRTNCVEHLFERLIKRKLVTNNVRICNIHILNERDEHLKYHINAGFLTISYDLDSINISENATDHERKKGTIDMIYEVLCHVSTRENWDINVVMDVYNQCLALDLKNEWWFKNKLTASPGRKYSVGLYHIYDTNRFDIYIVLFDKSKNELVRHLVYKSDFDSFQIEKISWTAADTISYKFSGPQKVFTYTVDDLLNGRVMEIPEKIHLLFK